MSICIVSCVLLFESKICINHMWKNLSRYPIAFEDAIMNGSINDESHWWKSALKVCPPPPALPVPANSQTKIHFFSSSLFPSQVLLRAIADSPLTLLSMRGAEKY